MWKIPSTLCHLYRHGSSKLSNHYHKIIDFESLFKKDLMHQIENGLQNSSSYLPEEKLLPLAKLEYYLEKNSSKIFSDENIFNNEDSEENSSEGEDEKNQF